MDVLNLNTVNGEKAHPKTEGQKGVKKKKKWTPTWTLKVLNCIVHRMNFTILCFHTLLHNLVCVTWFVKWFGTLSLPLKHCPTQTTPCIWKKHVSLGFSCVKFIHGKVCCFFYFVEMRCNLFYVYKCPQDMIKYWIKNMSPVPPKLWWVVMKIYYAWKRHRNTMVVKLFQNTVC